MATSKGTSTRVFITDDKNEIELQPTPLLDFVKSEEFINAVITNMMEQATVLPSGIAVMGQAECNWEYWRRGTSTDAEWQSHYRGTYADPEYPTLPMMPPCHPSRPTITGTWQIVRCRCVDARYHPETEPEPIEDDNVFSPRPAYVPVENF